jgi:hypothetical protein
MLGFSSNAEKATAFSLLPRHFVAHLITIHTLAYHHHSLSLSLIMRVLHSLLACAVLVSVLYSVQAAPIVSRFVHISDFHTDPLYTPAGNSSVNYCRTPLEPPIINGTRLPQRLVPGGQYGCDSPSLLSLSSYVE